MFRDSFAHLADSAALGEFQPHSLFVAVHIRSRARRARTPRRRDPGNGGASPDGAEGILAIRALACNTLQRARNGAAPDFWHDPLWRFEGCRQHGHHVAQKTPVTGPSTPARQREAGQARSGPREGAHRRAWCTSEACELFVAGAIDRHGLGSIRPGAYLIFALVTLLPVLEADSTSHSPRR